MENSELLECIYCNKQMETGSDDVVHAECEIDPEVMDPDLIYSHIACRECFEKTYWRL